MVVLSWNDLVSDPEGLAPAVSRAFGSDPECLGLLIVKELPSEYPTLRSRLLKLAERFAALDEGQREKYSDPASSFRCVAAMSLLINSVLSEISFGWSHGKVSEINFLQDNRCNASTAGDYEWKTRYLLRDPS